MKTSKSNERMKTPRGIRNNNPLNIRRSKTKWLGEVDKITVKEYEPVERTTEIYDRTFCQFQTLEHGWRAAFLLLKKYINNYGLCTIEKMIQRWAPPSENATRNYINDVSFHSCIYPDTELEFSDMKSMLAIGAAMCICENGSAYDPLKVDEWLQAMRGGYQIALKSEQFKKRVDGKV